MFQRQLWASACAVFKALRNSAIGITVAGTMVAATPALAREAAIVVDANTGEVLYASNPDTHRFPASLTKVMTLYMLFEQLDAGKINLNTRFEVSRRAASMPPSRLGVDAGDRIRVEDAIMSLVTRSANDVSVVIAENLAGSVENFAGRMTRKARQLGMSRTVFKNPNGLPNPDQYTTARDLSILGRALYERFPKYTHYFSRRSFAYEGEQIRNHNKLLGRVTGVDGIKTGYTRASGFNLLTSARYEGRHIVAVVMGGNTGRERDARMARLVQRYMPTASAHKRPDHNLRNRIRMADNAMEPITTADTSVARSNDDDAEPVTTASIPPKASTTAAATPAAEAPRTADRAPTALTTNQSAAPQPTQIQVQSGKATGASMAAAPLPHPTGVASQTVRPTIQSLPGARMVSTVAPAAPAMQWRTGAQPVQMGSIDDTAITGSIKPAPTAPVAAPVPVAAPAPAAAVQSGWVVQIAAASSEGEARRMLQDARPHLKGRQSNAQPVTEKVSRGGNTLYRARFAGFQSSDDAAAACASLKRSDFKCMPIRL